MYGGAHHSRSLNSSPSKINSPVLHPSKTLTTFSLTSLSYSSQSVTPMSYYMVDSIHPFHNHNLHSLHMFSVSTPLLRPFIRYSLLNLGLPSTTIATKTKNQRSRTIQLISFLLNIGLHFREYKAHVLYLFFFLFVD